QRRDGAAPDARQRGRPVPRRRQLAGADGVRHPRVQRGLGRERHLSNAATEQSRVRAALGAGRARASSSSPRERDSSRIRSLSISPKDPQGALHYDKDLRAMKDQGVGLYNAAMQSRALAVCADAATVASESTGTDAGDAGGGWGGTGI